jgi:hypothetical protein
MTYSGVDVKQQLIDWIEGEFAAELVEPGDFPWEGVGIYRGYTGGVSGLVEESDREITEPAPSGRGYSSAALYFV